MIKTELGRRLIGPNGFRSKSFNSPTSDFTSPTLTMIFRLSGLTIPGMIGRDQLLWVPGVSSLAYIGTAANKKLGDELCAYPRRFRLGGKKEAAGVCRGCGELMEFQSQPADTERVITLLDKADEAILSGPWPQYIWHKPASAAPAASFLSCSQAPAAITHAARCSPTRSVPTAN